MKNLRQYLVFNLRGSEDQYALLFEYLSALKAKRLAFNLWQIDSEGFPQDEEEFSEKVEGIFYGISHNVPLIQDSLVILHPFPHGMQEGGIVTGALLKFIAGPEA